MAYNVTAVGQSDVNGYGPAYLLNGLSDSGYWYQVGVSYDWPLTGGGYVQGFALNYEVFNTNGVSIFPTQGGGGLLSFSGPVTSGDIVVLDLYFSGIYVVMYAQDLHSGATASTNYSSEGATSFIGLPLSTINAQGFFTGLMTEWYHASPYYGNEDQATYSENDFAKSSAWMWIDEYEPGTPSWTGAFAVDTLIPSVYTLTPNTLQSFTSNGASESSDAHDFVTGAPTTASTTLTIIPAGLSPPLSASNEFVVSYLLNGQQSAAYEQGGTFSLTTDAETTISISGESTGSTSTEMWVFNSQASAVSLPSGTATTIYFYDLLLQSASYAVSGGGTQTSPTLAYYSAPSVASGQSSQTLVDLTLQPNPQPIWAVKGSVASINNPIPGGSGERWSMPTAQWTITSANLIPSPIVYYHQFYETIGYNVVGGGPGFSAPTIACTEDGTLYSIQASTSAWVDSGSQCDFSSELPGGSQNERWAASTPIADVTGPGTISESYSHQFLLSITGDGLISQWFNASSTATLSVPDLTERASGMGQRVVSYSIDGAPPQLVQSTIGTISITIIMNVAHALSVNSVIQYQVTLDSAVQQALVSISPPTISGDNYWYDQGSIVNLELSGVWNRSSGMGMRLVSYVVNGVSTTTSTTGTINALEISGIISPQTITGVAATQYVLNASSGSVVTVTPPSISGDIGWYDSGTDIIVTYNYSWNSTSGQSRDNAVSSSVNQNAPTTLKRSGGGTFVLELAMSSPNSVTIQSTMQYHFALSGGNNVTLSVTSPTDDSFYDSGSMLTASTDYTWGFVNGDARQNLISYSLDGSL